MCVTSIDQLEANGNFSTALESLEQIKRLLSTVAPPEQIERLLQNIAPLEPIDYRLSGEEKSDHTLAVINRKNNLQQLTELTQEAERIAGNAKPKVTEKEKTASLARNIELRQLLSELPQPFTSIRQVLKMNTRQAVQALETILWRNGRICPFCEGEKSWQLGDPKEKEYRITNYKCSDCSSVFNFKTGTMFEGCHLSADQILEAIVHEINLIGGGAVTEISRYIGVARKATGELLADIRRLAFRQQLFSLAVDTGKRKKYQIDVVELDGEDRNRHTHKKCSYYGGPQRSLFLVIKQEDGFSRAFKIKDEDGDTVIPIIRRYVPEGSVIFTDKATYFNKLKQWYLHKTVNHSIGVYGDDFGITTNGVEGVNSFIKCGKMKLRNNVSEENAKRLTNADMFRLNTADLTEAEQIQLAVYACFTYGMGVLPKVLKVVKEVKAKKRAATKVLKQLDNNRKRARLKPAKAKK